MSFLAPIAGAVVGGLMGGDSGGGQQTASKEPWEPTRKPLINIVNQGEDLLANYQRNPFNSLQQTGYQNLFGDIDAFRTQMAPGLMNFANGMMTSNYQRGPRNSQVEAMQSQPMMGQQKPMLMQGPDGVYQTKPMQAQGGSLEGLLGGMAQGGGRSLQGAQESWNGLLGSQPGMEYGFGQPQMGNRGPFSVPVGSTYGTLDWTQLNPFTATNGIPQTPVAEKPPEKTPEDLAREEWERLVRSGMGYIGSGA